MIPSKVYALGASGNPIREIADYAMRRAEEVGAENVYDFSIGSPSIARTSLFAMPKVTPRRETP